MRLSELKQLGTVRLHPTAPKSVLENGPLLEMCGCEHDAAISILLSRPCRLPDCTRALPLVRNMRGTLRWVNVLANKLIVRR